MSWNSLSDGIVLLDVDLIEAREFLDGDLIQEDSRLDSCRLLRDGTREQRGKAGNGFSRSS